jgi:hypothetical protein
VKRIKVLLAEELPPIVNSLLTYVIKGQTDMIKVEPDMIKIDEDVSGTVKLLLAARSTTANVIIMPMQESNAIPGVCTHLLSEHPDLLILGISIHKRPHDTKWGVAYRREITEDTIEAPLVENLLQAIRTTGSENSSESDE